MCAYNYVHVHILYLNLFTIPITYNLEPYTLRYSTVGVDTYRKQVPSNQVTSTIKYNFDSTNTNI
jgi:hypothetical protein